MSENEAEDIRRGYVEFVCIAVVGEGGHHSYGVVLIKGTVLLIFESL